MRAVMRLLLIILALGVSAAAAEPPSARTAYVERRGILEVDAQCRLFAPEARAALQVGAAQARGALLRDGWSIAQVSELERAIIAAARARACDDARTQSAAADARRTYGYITNANIMRFTGWERTWVARRVAGEDGWRLRQDIAAPIAAQFGVREAEAREQLVLTLQLERGAPAPATARLIMRDPARGAARDVSLSQHVAYGLEAGAPAPGLAQEVPSVRTLERLDAGHTQAVFSFPDAAFHDLARLDPRETAVIELAGPGVRQRLLIEVGDLAAARAFLAIGAR